MTIIAIALAAILLIGLLYVYATRNGRVAYDRLDDAEVSGQADKPADAAEICAAQRTYDELRRELFRKAAAIRGRDEAVFDAIARNAMLSVDRPRLVENDESLGQARCSGTLVVALPPGLATGNGLSQLRGEADYGVQAAADDSGPTVTLLSGESLTAALATLVRQGSAAVAAQPPASEPDVLLPAPSDVTPPTPDLQPSQEPAAAEGRTVARPSFDCAYAKTRGERAVCASDALADLDRRMAAQYVAAMRDAGPREARLLRTTRDRFLAYRDRCRNDQCIAETYRGRIREIGDIMSGDWRP
jgi:uncharacterized protein YecT (DUF1311 family)